MLYLSDRLCYKRSYNHDLNVSLDLSDLYGLDMLFDLSQSIYIERKIIYR